MYPFCTNKKKGTTSSIHPITVVPIIDDDDDEMKWNHSHSTIHEKIVKKNEKKRNFWIKMAGHLIYWKFNFRHKIKKNIFRHLFVTFTYWPYINIQGDDQTSHHQWTSRLQKLLLFEILENTKSIKMKFFFSLHQKKNKMKWNWFNDKVSVQILSISYEHWIQKL